MHENLVDIHVFIMFVEYIFADTMSHDKETNADVALANTCLVTKPVLTAK